MWQERVMLTLCLHKFSQVTQSLPVWEYICLCPKYNDPEQDLHLPTQNLAPFERHLVNSRRGSCWAADQATSCSNHLGPPCVISFSGFHSPVKLLEEAFQDHPPQHGAGFYAAEGEWPLSSPRPHFVTWVLSIPVCAQNLTESSMKITPSVSNPYPCRGQPQAKGAAGRQISKTPASFLAQLQSLHPMHRNGCK